MSTRGKNSADNIDFDFFDDGPNDRQQSRQSRPKSSLSNQKQQRGTPVKIDSRARSRHRSSSSSDSGESHTRHSVKIAANVPRVEVEDSDSDDSNHSARGKSNRSDDRGPVAHSSKSGDRSRSTSRSSTSRSRSRSASSTDSASTTDDQSGSDSDMTDVSPLHSPKEKKAPNGKKKVGIDDTVYDMESKLPTGGRSRPTSGKSNASSASAFDRLMSGDRDSLNLDLLMQAIMEMEEDRNKTHTKIVQEGVQKQNPTSINRRNMSFSNDRVKEIDRENQRLMRNILKNATMVQKSKKQPAKKNKPVAASHAPSAVNRLREQKRIEQENYALLRRLHSAKADPTLQRERQIDSFNNSKLYGVPMKAVHPSNDGLKSASYSSLDAQFSTHTRSRPSSATAIGAARPPSAKLTGSRPTSAKSVQSRPPSAKQTRSRPTSAKSDRPSSVNYVERPLSGKRKPRPAWDERW